MAKITRVEQAVPTIKTKKKVAAYARISMESERMNHSLSAQISYYSSLIQKNPDWQYAGVFADDGISGTGIAKRDEFKRMIEAADNGEIDIILTKSIQRFARNTVDLLETVRHLKDIGVEVRFEKEHINSMSGDGEVITKDCPNTGHKDCWTAEYRAKTSEKRRKRPNCKGSSVMTGKIKCVGCGCNFRRATQPSSTSESGKAYYWRCAERDGCETVGLREDVLKPFIAETLGIAEYDDGEFEKRIDHIDVLSATEMVFHFKDGRTVSRTWEQPKRVGRPWTDEQRAKFKESIKGRYTPELRRQMSEHMKQLRKERGKAWRKEK